MICLTQDLWKLGHLSCTERVAISPLIAPGVDVIPMIAVTTLEGNQKIRSTI